MGVELRELVLTLFGVAAVGISLGCSLIVMVTFGELVQQRLLHQVVLGMLIRPGLIRTLILLSLCALMALIVACISSGFIVAVVWVCSKTM